MQDPRVPHLDATKLILRYVKEIVDYGLLYKRGRKFQLNGFIDADWAGDVNDRRSTSGYYFGIGSAFRGTVRNSR